MNKMIACLVAVWLTQIVTNSAIAQTALKTPLPNGWHLLDLKESGVYGISLDKAYEFLKGKKSKPVVVAVIDGGIDTLHEDLKEVLWRNQKEIPGNGIDDDKNGYVDDIYGWNFLGGKDGRNITKESLERDRIYHQYKEKYEGKEINPENLSKDEKEVYAMWKKTKEELFSKEDEDDAMDLVFLKMAYQNMVKTDLILQKALGKTDFTGKDLENFIPGDERLKMAKEAFLGIMKDNDMMEGTNKDLMDDFKEYVESKERNAEAKEKAPKNYREEIVKDNYSDFSDRYYGNNIVYPGNDRSTFHGTHVAGIIGAKRNNDIGIDGVADNVRIMAIRVVPDGDERDKDVALAIRYAVDNGAQVVNMSFGKYFSPEKKWVDEAVKYAESKGVLLVAAAGNEARNSDSSRHFPTRILNDGTVAGNWISVGASSDLSVEQHKEDGVKYNSLIANFSNYGKTDVDVFAPGMKIYSTIPEGNKYGNAQGTSMASPVVAGLAAMILEYFPALSAEQVKYAIEKSVVAPGFKVNMPGTEKEVDMSELCKSGGIINAYEAVKLASALKGERDKAKPESKKPF